MAPSFLLLLAAALLLVSSSAKTEDETLFKGINRYRASINLPPLSANNNTECLADQIAEQLEDEDCTNTTTASTVPAMQNKLSNLPQLLAHCHLNITNTRDGVVMPACVRGQASDLVLAKFTTQSQYAKFLNDSRYSGAGVGAEDNWMVVVLSTTTPSGNFVKENSSGWVQAWGKGCYFVVLVVALLMALV